MSDIWNGLKTVPLGQAFGAGAGVSNLSTPNPFRRDERGSHNLTKIAEMIRDDRPTAIRLCREAGENPNSWLPENPR